MRATGSTLKYFLCCKPQGWVAFLSSKALLVGFASSRPVAKDTEQSGERERSGVEKEAVMGTRGCEGVSSLFCMIRS